MREFAPMRRSTCYCRFGTPYRKHTNIWTNVGVQLPMCDKADPCAYFAEHGHHGSTAQKGPSRIPGGWARGHPTEELWAVPEALVHTLCRASVIPVGPVPEELPPVPAGGGVRA
eukprot:scaffold450120_cov28-Prasinocladus_malaysianus.AAC.1